ncbi:MAG: GAF domain-containing protein, partial [Burkholderiales bacterium]
IVIVFRSIAATIDTLEQDQRQQKAVLFDAYSKCDVLLIQRAATWERCDSAEAYAHILTSATQNIQYIVEAAYRTFQAAYGRSDLPEDRIDFEVTFMTKSFHDGYITIPAAINKDGRQPRSMLIRDSQPEIYERTKTAELYRLDNPAMLIVSDTTIDPSYAELYSGQKTRIKSSIIFPVLSNQNRLLGTLVVHCDKRGFFVADRGKFWSDLMEIFAKRIAHEVLAIEAMQHVVSIGGTISIDPEFLRPY